MQKTIIVILAILVAGLTAVLGFVLQEPAITTVEIDRDRAAISAELATAQSESEKYQGGAIKALLSTRVEALRHTLTMLDQKRESFLRRISLVYTIDGHQAQPASDATLNDILEELAGVEKRIASAKIDADRYSGGLVRSLKLMTVATEELSAAQIRMKFFTAKYSLPLPIIAKSGEKPPTLPPGKVVSDGEAL